MRTVDLDALIPEQGEITLNGAKIKVEAPSTGQAIRLMRSGSKLQDLGKGIEGGELNEDTAKDFDELVEVIKDIIPELKEQKLYFNQTIELMTMIMEMVMPADSKELEARGVKVDADPKVKAA